MAVRLRGPQKTAGTRGPAGRPKASIRLGTQAKGQPSAITQCESEPPGEPIRLQTRSPMDPAPPGGRVPKGRERGRAACRERGQAAPQLPCVDLCPQPPTLPPGDGANATRRRLLGPHAENSAAWSCLRGLFPVSGRRVVAWPGGTRTDRESADRCSLSADSRA